jgi:hypothetical protein
VPLYRIAPSAAVEIEQVDVDHDHDDQERPCPLGSLNVPLEDGQDDEDAERRDRASVAELVLVMLDWMGDHKSTWTSAAGVWTMLETLVPKKTGICVFSRVKKVLVAHLNGRLQTVDVCPCGYTVYTDCTSAAFSAHEYQNSHRTFCPRPTCGLSRKLPGIQPPVSRKVTALYGYDRF